MERDQQLEGSFYQYMHQSSEVDPEWNREVLSHYVSYFAQCQSVLDVGCGQGDFLELLQATGVEGVGIDVDAGMVDTCLQKGLRAVQIDVFDYLPECKGRFDGIFSSNLIEHLSAEEAARFMRLAFDSLIPGGLFLIATPNPASPIVHLHEFWRDATHVRLYNRSLLEFLLDWAGFVEVQSDENPVTTWEPSEALQAVPGRFKELTSLRGAMHWGFKARHPASLGSPPFEAKSTSDGEGRSSGYAASWSSRRDKLVADTHRRSLLGRFVFSLRRGLARFLADTLLFEELAALNSALSDLTRALNQTSIDLARALSRTSSELTDMNSTLSEKFSTLGKASVTIQEIEKALYQSHISMLITPREVFARGVKPFPKGEETE